MKMFTSQNQTCLQFCQQVLVLAILASAFPVYSQYTFQPGKQYAESLVSTPLIISDRDESNNSATSASVGYQIENNQEVLNLTYSVSENNILGYQYAGIAFPFDEPQELVKTAIIGARIKSSSQVVLQFNVRDTNRKNSFSPEVTVMPGDWRMISFPADIFSGVDSQNIESISISIVKSGSGEMLISDLSFPIPAEQSTSQYSRENSNAVGINLLSQSPLVQDPVPISDGDESPSTNSSITYLYREIAGADDQNITVLEAEFSVQKNSTLGYEYAGIAFPFPNPLQGQEDGFLKFHARSTVPISSFEVVLRDTDHRRSVKTISLPAGDNWSSFYFPISDFNTVNLKQLESFAVVVQTSPSEGFFQIGNLELSVQADPAETNLMQEVQFQPKWYFDKSMAETIAARLNKPMLILGTQQESNVQNLVNQLGQNASWQNVFSQTVNLVLVADTDNGGKIASELGITSTPIISVRDQNKELIRVTNFSDSSAENILQLLNNRQ